MKMARMKNVKEQRCRRKNKQIHKNYFHMAKEKGHGGGGGGPGGGGGGGGGHGGGGHATEKAKAFVESALGMTEIAAYNVLPYITAAREIFRTAAEKGTGALFSGYLGGLWLAFVYSFGKEMLTHALGKLGGGGGGH